MADIFNIRLLEPVIHPLVTSAVLGWNYRLYHARSDASSLGRGVVLRHAMRAYDDMLWYGIV